MQILTSGSVWKKRMNDFCRREQRKIIHHFPLFYVLFVLSEEGNKRLHRSSIRWLIANCRRHRRRSRDLWFFSILCCSQAIRLQFKSVFIAQNWLWNWQKVQNFPIFKSRFFFKSFTIFIRFISHFLVSSFLLHQNLCILSVQSYNIYSRMIHHPSLPFSLTPVFNSDLTSNLCQTTMTLTDKKFSQCQVTVRSENCQFNGGKEDTDPYQMRIITVFFRLIFYCWKSRKDKFHEIFQNSFLLWQTINSRS